MKRELLVFPDADAVARAAASKFVELANASTSAGKYFTVALSGGETPRKLYRLLATDHFSRQIDWSRVHIFWGDERCVPPDHPDSNYGLAKLDLVDHVPIPQSQVHRMVGELEPHSAATNYEESLKAHFKNTSPAFDLIILGLGADGHTASLFSGSPGLTEGYGLVLAIAHPETRQWRLTLTLHSINASRHVFFLVVGSAKAVVVKEMIEDPQSLLPAAMVRPRQQLYYILDSYAAGSLTRAAAQG